MLVETHGCHYGIDMATRAELIGADLTIDEIRDFVDADSLHYISLDGLIATTPQRRGALCTACFSGEYPIPVPGERDQLGQIAFDLRPVEIEDERLADAREGRTVE